MIINGLGTAAEADTTDFVSSSDIRIANWDAAFSWGNHAAAGYLTSFTESDPVFTASAAASITTTNITNWNSAFSWGDHSAAGYLTSAHYLADDHAQYAMLAGRAGGQTLIGGTNASNNLTLSSTSNATKGRILLANSVYSETNNKFAINGSVVSGSYVPVRDFEVFNRLTKDHALLYDAYVGQLFIDSTPQLVGNPGIFGHQNTFFAFTSNASTLSGATNVANNFNNYTCLLMRRTGTGTGKFLVGQDNLGNDQFTIDNVGNISTEGNNAKSVSVNRHTTANTAGNNLTVQAGGATVGATDKNGGTQIVSGGIATGTGESGVKIQTAVAGTSGTADRTPTNVAIEALGNKLAFNGATPVTKPTVTGSRGGNAALASLLTALAQLGLITDSTTA